MNLIVRNIYFVGEEMRFTVLVSMLCINNDKMMYMYVSGNSTIAENNFIIFGSNPTEDISWTCLGIFFYSRRPTCKRVVTKTNYITILKTPLHPGFMISQSIEKKNY